MIDANDLRKKHAWLQAAAKDTAASSVLRFRYSDGYLGLWSIRSNAARHTFARNAAASRFTDPVEFTRAEIEAWPALKKGLAAALRRIPGGTYAKRNLNCHGNAGVGYTSSALCAPYEANSGLIPLGFELFESAELSPTTGVDPGRGSSTGVVVIAAPKPNPYAVHQRNLSVRFDSAEASDG